MIQVEEIQLKIAEWMRDPSDSVKFGMIFIALQVMALLGLVSLGDLSNPIILVLVKIQLILMLLETIFITITLIAGCIYGAYRYEEDLHVED